ncbi:50S ribosomal protein L21 [bacterium DOLZORAL124_38_8]|nr:MAG: 50S ribosomal protein L21 [bacterium DOLZORAL124_38_8]
MIAIAKIGGHQALVEAGEIIEVDLLKNTKEGDKVQFETLLISEADGKNFEIGTPIIEGKTVEAKVLEHGRGKKVRVFKMKPRKRYRKTQGHRQDYTLIEIISIGGTKATKKAAPKKTSAKKEDDLTKIEGIGPKIAETLANAGVETFAKLAKTDAGKIAEIIADVRGNHTPDTWPKQAEMAAAGKWDELKAWQEELNGGK